MKRGFSVLSGNGIPYVMFRDTRERKPATARARMGYDVFIVGDEMRADIFDKDRASVWDAITAFGYFLLEHLRLI
jgi:hypothetical protein